MSDSDHATHGHGHGASKAATTHGHAHGASKAAATHGHAHGSEASHGHAHDPSKAAPSHGPAHGSEAGHGHAHEQAHGHAHGFGGMAQRTLGWALGLTAVFLIVEATVGFMSGSLALLADAGHMLADAASLALALVAQKLASRPRTVSSTFGLRRAEVLAAFVNGMTLTAFAALIVKEGVERWFEPVVVAGAPVVWTALLGLLLNLFVAWILSRDPSRNVNVRAALAHVLTDALGSVGAILAGLLVLGAGWQRADSVLSILIALLVAFSGYRVLRETSSILLEGAPRHLDVTAIEKTIGETPGVLDVHDLHVWQISEHFDALSVHIVIERGRHGTEMCREVAERLRRGHQLEHVTIQPEPQPPDEVVQVRRSLTGDRLPL